MQNWAGNIVYAAQDVVRPSTVDELCEVIRTSAQVKALGSRHSFNDIADTDGIQVSLDAMPDDIVVDPQRKTVRCGAGVTHARLSEVLHASGLAMPNMASLPHISVGGAIQTGTHGSGVGNRALSAAVTAVTLVDADGTPHAIEASHDDFNAVVVGLGAFGVVLSVEQRVVPAFDVEQQVIQGVTWDALLPVLDDVMSAAYSVSLFSRFADDSVDRVWVKRRVADEPSPALARLGGAVAASDLHPVPGWHPEGVTRQGGVPGPSHERLPHFRPGFTPSHGEEIQTEFFVDAADAVTSIDAVRALGSRISDILHVAEIRRVAADDALLSPTADRPSLGIHFTWHRREPEVRAAVRMLERELLPLGARPHWGKYFTCSADELVAAYPRLAEFERVRARRDPLGRFDNAFLRRALDAVR